MQKKRLPGLLICTPLSRPPNTRAPFVIRTPIFPSPSLLTTWCQGTLWGWSVVSGWLCEKLPDKRIQEISSTWRADNLFKNQWHIHPSSRASQTWAVASSQNTSGQHHSPAGNKETPGQWFDSVHPRRQTSPTVLNEATSYCALGEVLGMEPYRESSYTHFLTDVLTISHFKENLIYPWAKQTPNPKGRWTLFHTLTSCSLYRGCTTWVWHFYLRDRYSASNFWPEMAPRLLAR